MSPLFEYTVQQGMVAHSQEMLGVSMHSRKIVHGDFFGDENELVEAERRIVGDGCSNGTNQDISYMPATIDTVLAACETQSARLVSEAGKIREEYLQKAAQQEVDNPTLSALLQRYFEQQYHMGPFLPVFPGFMEKRADGILTQLKDRLGAQVVSYASSPSAPLECTKAAAARKELEKLVREELRMKELASLVHTNQLIAALGDETKRMLGDFVREYGWLDLNHFKGRELTSAKVMEQIVREITQERTQPAKVTCHKIISNETEFNPASLSDADQALMQQLRRIVYNKNARKDFMNKAYYLMMPVLSEVAERIGVSLYDIPFLLPEEIIHSLDERRSGTANDQTANDRLAALVCARMHGFSMLTYAGDTKIFQPSVEVYHGRASNKKGSYTGKIMKITEMSELEKAKDRMVLMNTTGPGIVPYLPQIKCLVTEAGAVTSHPAQLIREVGTPMVIGVEGIYRRLNNDDLVVVNTDSGIVAIASGEAFLGKSASRASKPYTVLHIEDYEQSSGTNFSELLRQRLVELDSTIAYTNVETVEDALQMLLEKNKWDIIVSDGSLPVKKGMPPEPGSFLQLYDAAKSYGVPIISWSSSTRVHDRLFKDRNEVTIFRFNKFPRMPQEYTRKGVNPVVMPDPVGVDTIAQLIVAYHKLRGTRAA